jgi:CDP-diacylglycerol--glycerol-3-phosphate 3-phosphatidyltransferase
MINISILLWIWIAVIAIVKVINIALGFIRRKELVALHTVFNKITGLLLFLLPLTLHFIKPVYNVAVVCTVATIAAIVEGYYTIKVHDK